mgnify:FL=1
MKAEISNLGKKEIIDFATEKGYISIISSLEKIGITNHPFDIEANEVDLKFIEKEKGILKIIPKITKPDSYLYHICLATHYIVNTDETFINTLQTQINNGKINDVRDIIDLNWNYKERYSSPSHFFLAKPGRLMYEQIKFNGQSALFTNQRIDKYLLPKNVYAYEAMHDDEFNGEITCIAKNIHVNFLGTILTDKPIKIENEFRFVDEDKDINFIHEQGIKQKDLIDYQRKMTKQKTDVYR